MYRILSCSLLLLSILDLGCTTKKYVNQQVVPIIDKVNALDQSASANTHDLAATSEHLDQTVAALNPAIADTDSRAASARQWAEQANQSAKGVTAGTDSLVNALKNADNFQSVRNASVQFAEGGDQLDEKATDAVDDIANRVPENGDYVLTLKGNTDAVGPHEYNYELSKRRAMAVAAYLAAKFQVPAYRIFVVGLGPDLPVAENKTRSGRSRNRRVDITLFTNAPPTEADEEPAQIAAKK
jgi:outer membrane protein OmpA-like peptidoglycan-associated protein